MGGNISFKISLLISFLALSLSAFSAEQINVETLVFKAGDKALSFEQVREIGLSNFQNIQEIGSDQGFTDQHFWLRITMTNENASAFEGVSVLGRPITDNIEWYPLDGAEALVGGDKMPFSERSFQHRLSGFPFKIEPKSSRSFLVHLKSDGETLDLAPKVYSEQEFQQLQYKQQLFLGLFYGMLIISALIYLFFYSSLNEKSFRNYSLYIISIALLQASLDGFIYQYIFPSGSYISNRMVLITAAFSNFFLLKYSGSFLKLKERSPKLSRAYRVFYYVIPAVATLLFINAETLKIAYPLSNVVGLLSLILILISVVHVHRKIQKVDPFFLAGIVFLVFGLLAFVLNNLSLLPNIFWVQNMAKMGIGLEVVFLSLSMTNLIGKLRRAKERSQAEALKHAQEVSSFKSYFMSNISHELRTPINAILGLSTNELENKNAKAEEQENYRIIRSAAHSLLSNVNDILDYEQIEKNELELQMDQKFDPAEALNDLCESWYYEASKKDINLDWVTGDRLPQFLMGDEKRFRQIINHLLSNAVKFTEAGQIKVGLHATVNDEGVASLKLSVSDSGVGMNDQERQEIFESFNQMKRNNKRRHGGLGLGLTIVKHLIELFGATLKVESELGFGTTVRVWMDLDVAQVQVEEIEVKEVAEEIVEQTEVESSEIRILVAEDNMMNQMILKKILGDQANISLEMANDGALAMKALLAKKYDLILMDLQMPNMDGYEACEAIRRGEAGKHHTEIPIIAVTADATQETRKRVFEIGMNAYLTKPVRKEQLLEKIFELGRSMKVAI